MVDGGVGEAASLESDRPGAAIDASDRDVAGADIGEAFEGFLNAAETGGWSVAGDRGRGCCARRGIPGGEGEGKGAATGATLDRDDLLLVGGDISGTGSDAEGNRRTGGGGRTREGNRARADGGDAGRGRMPVPVIV